MTWQPLSKFTKPQNHLVEVRFDNYVLYDPTTDSIVTYKDEPFSNPQEGIFKYMAKKKWFANLVGDVKYELKKVPFLFYRHKCKGYY